MDTELVQLDQIYADPGVLLLATDSRGERLGCVGLRSLGQIDGVLTAEIRRLFVREQGRGSGLGTALIGMIADHAEAAGFGRLVLNTLPAMYEARRLYGAHGFGPIEPYVDEPLDDTMYLGREI